MSLSLNEVRRIAGDVARTTNPSLEVVAATTAEGGCNYTEVTLTLKGCVAEPCMMVIGQDRSATEPAFRAAVDAQLRQHLEGHTDTGSPRL